MWSKSLRKILAVAAALALLLSAASVWADESKVMSLDTEVQDAEFIKVKFVVGGDTRYTEVEAGKPVQAPRKAPEKEGYAFRYWYDYADEYQEEYDFGLPVSEPLVLAALFVPVKEEAPPAEEPEEDPVKENPEAPAKENPEEPKEEDPEEPEEEKPEDPEEPIEEDPEEPEEDPEEPEEDPEEPEEDTGDEEGEEPAAEDPDEPGDEDEDEPESNRRIHIYSDAPDIVRKGQVITLYADLIGYEDCVLSLRWQSSTDGGATWADVTGGTGYTYAFAATKELVGSLWRLAVTILQEG
jgi:hypothetical protein